MTVCKKCLLTTDYPGLEFDSRGICQLCRSDDRGFRASPPDRLKEDCLRDFEGTIDRIRGKYPYDALLCLSGGKDSSYLAYLLTEKYGLNILAYNMQPGFGSPLAQPNLSRVVNKLGMKLNTFSWPPDFSQAFYRHLFTHPLREGLTATVCRVCHLALHSSAIRLAQKEEVPLVLIGYSPFQVTRNWFYEMKKDTFLGQFRAIGDFWDQPGISPEIRDRFYFPAERENTPFPRILMPMHILDYPSEIGVRKKLQELGLLDVKRTLTRRTTCDLRWLMAHCDTLHFGEPPFRDWVSEKIRKGEESRLKYILGFKAITWLTRARLLKRRRIRSALRKLGLTEREVLDSLEKARESEEIFDDIYKINPSRDVIADLKKNR
ncbi:MAG: hypothetical protein U9N73_03755 [Candidatus Auribacterota bacterium]|nr:hypothetical protein [Candidatus Auribacterota bacterium]